MTALDKLSPETIALFARAERATLESRRLIELIQSEHLRGLDGLNRLLDLGRDFSRRSQMNYCSDTTEIRARARASSVKSAVQSPPKPSRIVRPFSR